MGLAALIHGLEALARADKGFVRECRSAEPGRIPKEGTKGAGSVQLPAAPTRLSLHNHLPMNIAPCVNRFEGTGAHRKPAT
jgi:hypothetical protein